jgi:hypothetical protein
MILRIANIRNCFDFIEHYLYHGRSNALKNGANDFCILD